MKFTKKNILDFLYHTNALDGYSYPKQYIEKFYDHVVTAREIGKAPLMRCPHLSGQLAAIEYVKENKKRVPFISDVTKLHKLMFEGISLEPGLLRDRAAMIGTKRALPARDISIYLTLWLKTWGKKPKKNLTHKECAALRHCEFIYIYPFAEGTYRLARIFLLWDCLHHKTNMDIIKEEDRLKYYDEIKLYTDELRAGLIDTWA